MTDLAFNPFDPETLEDPFPGLARLRREEPVYKVPGVAMDLYMVTRYDDVEFVTKHPELFSNAPLASGFVRSYHDDPEFAALHDEIFEGGHSLPSLDPPEHTVYRRLWNSVFVPRFKRLDVVVRDICNEFVDGFVDRGEADLVTEFAGPVTVAIMAAMLGLPRADVPDLKRYADLGVATLGGALSREQELENRRFTAAFHRHVADEVRNRASSAGDDLLSDIVKATLDGKPLPVADQLAMVGALLTAGTETTTKMVATGMRLLLEHPDQLRAVIDDPSLVATLVEEVLRYEGPVKGLFRLALADVEVGGVTIPKGALVQLMWMSANRDERQWASADNFDVRRTEARLHFGFGGGIHTCLGAPLARLEGRVAFDVLLQRLPGLALAPGRNDFRHEPSAILYGLEHLWVTFEAGGAPRAA